MVCVYDYNDVVDDDPPLVKKPLTSTIPSVALEDKDNVMLATRGDVLLEDNVRGVELPPERGGRPLAVEV